jgi:hypothetical protein
MYSCDSNADCINTVGSYSCQCRNGYTGDGRVCTGNFRRISDIFRYANYVTAGIYFRYISIRQLCHSWYMLYNSLFVETPRKFITNKYVLSPCKHTKNWYMLCFTKSSFRHQRMFHPNLYVRPVRIALTLS